MRLLFVLITQFLSWAPWGHAQQTRSSIASEVGPLIRERLSTANSAHTQPQWTPTTRLAEDAKSSQPGGERSASVGTTNNATLKAAFSWPAERQTAAQMLPGRAATGLAFGLIDAPSWLTAGLRWIREALPSRSRIEFPDEDDYRAVWVSSQWLLWEAKRGRVPPLVTTDPNDGVLPDATILLGNEPIGGQRRAGGRLRIGAWADPLQRVGWEASFLALGEERFVFHADSSDFPLLARPFFNFTDDLQGGFVGQDAFLVADPGNATGTIQVENRMDLLVADLTRRLVLRSDSQWRVDLLTGYKTSRIDGGLQIRSTSELIGQDTTLTLVDVFRTKNAFHGGHIGFEIQRMFPSGASLDFEAKVGLGNMRQWVLIDGFQETVSGGISDTAQGGLLAQSTNMGLRRRDAFTVTPELVLQYRYPASRHLNLLAAYTFIYWNRVALPADQIDRDLGVNPNQPPGPGEPQRPEFVFRDTDYYVHGVSLGLEWSF